MPDSMYQLLTADGATEICEVMNVIYGYDRSKIVSKLYGGGFMVQTIGTKTKQLEVTLRARSQEEMIAVNDAEADGDIVMLNYKGVHYSGYIVDKPSWSSVVRGEIYTASVAFAVIDEVSA